MLIRKLKVSNLDAPLQLKESDPDRTCFATFSCMKHTYTFLWAVRDRSFFFAARLERDPG
jgi:hypothetical protein